MEEGIGSFVHRSPTCVAHRKRSRCSIAASQWSMHRRVICPVPASKHGCRSAFNSGLQRSLECRDTVVEGSLPPLDPTQGDTLPVRKEVLELARLGTPAFLQGCLTFSLTSIVFLFLGRLGTHALSTASLALSFFSLTGGSVVVGLSMGIETISGQAHGAGNERLIQLALLQGLTVSLTTSVLISLLWCNAESLFVMLGQKAIIAQSASIYLRLLIPYLFVDVCFTCLSKSLASRGIVRSTAIASVLATALSPMLSWLLIFKTPLKLYGAPIALCIIGSFSLTLLMLLSRLDWVRISCPVTEWISEIWTTLPMYLSVTFPGLASLCSEWWAYEIFTVLAGLLNHPEQHLGVMGASNAIINTLFVFALAIEAGTIVRVSNFLGAGRKTAATATARIAIGVSVCIESISLLCLCLFSRFVSKIWFSDHHPISAAFMSILPLVGLTEWGSGMSFVMGAVLRACNRGAFAFAATVGCYWFLGIPLGCILGFAFGLGVRGFWLGLTVAALSQFLVLTVVFSRLDFELEIKRAQALTAF